MRQGFGRLPEDNAVLMLDRRVLKLTVRLAVTRAVVLHLDNDAANLAVREVQYIPDDGRVLALPGRTSPISTASLPPGSSAS